MWPDEPTEAQKAAHFRRMTEGASVLDGRGRFDRTGDPEPPVTPPTANWAKRAIAATTEISRMGLDAWLEREESEPSFLDPEWTKLIREMAQERASMKARLAMREGE